MSANIGIALQIFMLHEFWVFVAVVLVAWLRWSLTHSSKHHACLEVSLRVRVFVGLHTLELSILAHAVVRTIFFQKYDYLGLMRHWFWTADGSGEYPRKCVKRWPLPLNLKSNEPPLIFKIYWQRVTFWSPLKESVWSVTFNKWNRREEIPTCHSRLYSTQSCPRGSSCGSEEWFRSWSRPAARDPGAPSSPQLPSTRGLSPARSPSWARFHEDLPDGIINNNLFVIWPDSLWEKWDKEAIIQDKHRP